MKLNSLLTYSSVAAALMTTNALAQNIEVTIQNLTQGIHYTPIIVAAHDSSISLYQLGATASPELQAMAEGGDISGLKTLLSGANANIVENPAGGLLAPSMSTTAMLNTSEGNNYLSLATMLLPTNDGFVGLNSWMIPADAGTYMFFLDAYDAGTEANDEIINGGGAPGVPGIPIAPASNGGSNGSGVTSTEANQYIHVHRGNLGDDDLMGGKSDLDNTVHRWLNPVAKVTVVVK